MKKYAYNKRIKQRVLYTLCFFALCLIDWIKGSLNGRAQMTATNMTGIVLAVIIFSAYNLKAFLKPAYAIWLLLCITFTPVCVHAALSSYPYRGQIITATLNIILYGIIIIKIYAEQRKIKTINGIKALIFLGWIIMLALMFFSVNENIWPIWYAIIFGSFYLTKIDKDTEMNIYMSILDGIILGFFAIQGMALLFRPYDVIRYSGLYINPNFNALFYLMSYSAFICKWYFFKKEGKNPVFRTVLCLFAASMYGFCVYTGSKSAILAMLVVTVPFSILICNFCTKKVISFLGCWIILGLVGVISVPIVYGAIRYMPTMHLHPLYFEGEYSTAKIQPGEPRDSEKYISFEAAMEINTVRLFYKFPKLMEYIDSILTMRVQAAELVEYQTQEYLFTEEEVAAGIDPLDLRKKIYKYYIDRLNLSGHRNDYEGAQISLGENAPHAHNVFIQMAFLYGIPAGIMFILMVLAFVPGCISLMKSGENFRVCVIVCFVLAFVVFGFFEIDWMCGQLPFTLFFLLFRDVVRKTQKC